MVDRENKRDNQLHGLTNLAACHLSSWNNPPWLVEFVFVGACAPPALARDTGASLAPLEPYLKAPAS